MIWAILLYLLYIWYSINSNYDRIQAGAAKGKKRIKHIWEDVLQVAFTTWIVYLVHGISWPALSLAVGLFAMYWLIFDLGLNKRRGKDWWYRSKEWYDQVLPANKYVAISIKIVLMISGYVLSLVFK